MTTIAVYNLKGGVGKTSTAVNLAWCSAQMSSRRTLLWDLDPQAAATWLIGKDKQLKDEAQAVLSKRVDADKLIRKSTVKRLDLLAADASLRGLDRMFFDLGKKKRLKKLISDLSKDYDRIILDCPPGLTETSDQVLRAADLIIVPVIPSPLSYRAFMAVRDYLDRQGSKHAPMLPVHSMVDRRRAMHLKALEDHPGWPVIPSTSAVEQMAKHRAPMGAFAPSNPASLAFRELWQGIERKIATL
ncbi:ParA family protein [Alterisphingorhabdus coralli]|uniref:ParA family protein n=1 Tax=Alterisphingorhabdus coralli TaxID=3071408 RepID=A0AA97F7T2_9SPHN|nr:ParA family protein [Parasphingorhabdus sp. SCSIO 66989]WOE75989.1 ParA family protein [Parasphingorhabdus sp. SCSIO 66989]